MGMRPGKKDCHHPLQKQGSTASCCSNLRSRLKKVMIEYQLGNQHHVGGYLHLASKLIMTVGMSESVMGAF